MKCQRRKTSQNWREKKDRDGNKDGDSIMNWKTNEWRAKLDGTSSGSAGISNISSNCNISNSSLCNGRSNSSSRSVFHSRWNSNFWTKRTKRWKNVEKCTKITDFKKSGLSCRIAWSMQLDIVRLVFGLSVTQLHSARTDYQYIPCVAIRGEEWRVLVWWQLNWWQLVDLKKEVTRVICGRWRLAVNIFHLLKNVSHRPQQVV